MEWYEYIIMMVAIFLVVLPIILSIRNKKKGKSSCTSNCSCCSMHNSCESLKAYLEEIKREKEKTSSVVVPNHQ